MNKKKIGLFDNSKINDYELIKGGLAGSMGSTTQYDTGAKYGAYDKETTPAGGGCDKTNTGLVGGNGEVDNPNERF